MFKRDGQKIADYANRGPDELADVLLFVLLTIKTPLERMPYAMKDVRQRGMKSSALWGYKKDAWQMILDRKDEIYQAAQGLAAIPDPIEAERQLIAYFAELHGFGLAKAGFVAQLAFGLGGCLDTHNLTRFGLDPARFKDFKRFKRWVFKRKMLDYYQKMLHKHGGCERLWDSWCEFVAKKSGQTADSVSRLHVEAILGG